MPVYTVHEPPRRNADDDMLEHAGRFSFVRDGFHFWAFLLAPFWMLRHRLWIEFILYVLIVGGTTFALRRLGIEASAGGWVALFTAVLIGMEASSLRRWKLSRRGYEQVGIVVGDNIEDAERRFFDGWVGSARARRDGARAASAVAVRPATRAAVVAFDRCDRPVPAAAGAAMSVAIVDYGSGNLHSAAKAFERAAREVRPRPADPGHRRSGQGPRRRPRGAARRRRLRGLPPRARCGARHGRGAERDGARKAASRSSASASACS